MAKSCGCCAVGAGQQCVQRGSILLGGREQVWRRNLSDRPLPKSAPLAQTGIEDELLCGEVVPIDAQAEPLSKSAQKFKLGSDAPLPKSAEKFKLHSERNCNSDDEDDITGLEAEDTADSLNNLLVLEESLEGVRRYRSSVDDADRIAHRQSMAREEVVPSLVDYEVEPDDACDAKVPALERRGRSQAKLSLSHRFLCFLVAATLVLGLAALWRNGNQSRRSAFLSSGNEPSLQRGLHTEQSADQRPGSSRLENLQNRNRLSWNRLSNF